MVIAVPPMANTNFFSTVTRPKAVARACPLESVIFETREGGMHNDWSVVSSPRAAPSAVPVASPTFVTERLGVSDCNCEIFPKD